MSEKNNKHGKIKLKLEKTDIPSKESYQLSNSEQKLNLNLSLYLIPYQDLKIVYKGNRTYTATRS